MSPSKASGIGILRSPTDLLDLARRRVASRINEHVVTEGARNHGASSVLDGLVALVRHRLLNGRADVSTEGEDSWRDAWNDPTANALLTALSAEILDLPNSPEAAAAAIEVLRVTAELQSDLRSRTSRHSEELEQRLRAPDAFQLLIEVAHDFRSPLASILFLAETLRDGQSGPVTATQRSQLGLVYSAAFGLAGIASDIMDLARQERDLIDLHPEAYALAEVFASVERLVHPIVDAKGLSLDVVLPEGGRAVGHPRALSRVLLNLATNALKFTDEGRVEIGAIRRPRGRIEFYVQDSGRGIPEERRQELFQPFKRRIGESQDGHFFSGSGVGLSIARRLVRAMESDLHFTTSDEEGTRFWFEVMGDRPRGR